MNIASKKVVAQSSQESDKKAPQKSYSPNLSEANPLWRSLATHVGNDTITKVDDSPPILRKTSASQIQAKFTVGSSDDPMEREADAVADKVMRMPSCEKNEQLKGEANCIQRKGLEVSQIQRKPSEQNNVDYLATKISLHTPEINPGQKKVIQRQDNDKSGPVEPEEQEKSSEVLSEGASIAYDNLKLAPGFEAWKKQQTGLLKYKLWDSQPISYKAGLISSGAFALTGLGVAVAADSKLRDNTVDLLQDKNILMPLSLVPYSEYFPVSSFKYTLPSAENAPYKFKTEFEFDPWLDLMSKRWGMPKTGLSLGVGSAYAEQGGFSAVKSGNIKLTFGGGIINLSGFVNDTLPVTPMLITNPRIGEQPMWIMRSLPDQLSHSLPKGTGVFITIDVQRLPQLLGISKPEPKEKLQRKETDGRVNADATQSVNKVLSYGGKALEKPVRDFMEPKFGRDFSDVRVHTDQQAADSAKSINARAYTSGRNLVFDTGQYNPSSEKGKHLLAHELTHVVQQSSSSTSIQRKGPEEDQEAKKAAQKVKIDKVKQSIKTTFGVSSVLDGTKNWTEAELTILNAAFTMLSATDKTTLQGITIKRVASLGGTTAGRFSYGINLPTGGSAFTQEAKMELADLAYSGTNDQAKRTIIHEVGHAVAGEKLQEANVSHAQAVADMNVKASVTTDTFRRFEPAKTSLDETIQALKDKRIELNREKDPAKKTEIKKEIKALKAAHKIQLETAKSLLQNNTDAAAAEQTARNTANNKKLIADSHKILSSDLITIKKTTDMAKTSHTGILQTAKANIPKIKQSEDKLKSYSDAVFAVSMELESFFSQSKDQDKSEDDVETLIAAVDSSIINRVKAKKALGTDKGSRNIIVHFAALESEQEKYFAAIKKNSLAHNRSKIVQGFAVYAETHNIEPITHYANKNWPHKPEEFYAEAYSYWIMGKFKGQTGALQTQYDLLQAWFDSGKYR